MMIHNYKIFGVTVPSYVSSIVVLLSAETPGMCVSGGCVQQPGSDPVRTLYCPYLEYPNSACKAEFSDRKYSWNTLT
jgi:hypothetical protein